jgi:hypothetical protein
VLETHGVLRTTFVCNSIGGVDLLVVLLIELWGTLLETLNA